MNDKELEYRKEYNKKTNYKYQRAYTKSKMKNLTLSYKIEFVDEFNDACKKLGVVKSQLIKKLMQDTINKAKNKG